MGLVRPFSGLFHAAIHQWRMQIETHLNIDPLSYPTYDITLTKLPISAISTQYVTLNVLVLNIST